MAQVYVNANGSRRTLEKVGGAWVVKDEHGGVLVRGSRGPCESYLRRSGYTPKA